MIGFLRGILALKGEGSIIIDVGGVGYRVIVPSNTSAYLNSEGQEITVYTTMIVREDDVSLYGFSGRNELDAFRKLISVSGVGPKAGIAILSAFTYDQLQQAIIFEDAKALQKANGIGKKTAERIVLELKDKFGAGVAADGIVDIDSDTALATSNERSEAISGLVALGYTRGEATSALAGVKGDNLTAEEYIKKALKNLF